MNRCNPRTLPLLRAALVAAVALALPFVSAAQDAPEATLAVRQFPAAALRGELVVLASPAITLDGREDRLSPGARIRDANNLLVMSGSLVNQKLVVNYLRESAGNVHDVWILNSEEASLKRPNTKASWFNFGGKPSQTIVAPVARP